MIGSKIIGTMSLSSKFASVVSSVLKFLFPTSDEIRLRKINQSKKLKIEKEKRFLHQKYDRQKRALLLKYGSPVYNLALKEQSLNNEIIVFEKSRRVMILGEIYAYSDFSSCTYTDNQRILKGEASFVTKLNAQETNLFTGFEYDIYQTAGLEKSNISNKDIITHNYSIIIKLNDSPTSIIKIPMGSNLEKVTELLGVINSIIEINSRSVFVRMKQAVSWSS